MGKAGKVKDEIPESTLSEADRKKYKEEIELNK